MSLAAQPVPAGGRRRLVVLADIAVAAPAISPVVGLPPGIPDVAFGAVLVPVVGQRLAVVVVCLVVGQFVLEVAFAFAAVVVAVD